MEDSVMDLVMEDSVMDLEMEDSAMDLEMEDSAMVLEMVEVHLTVVVAMTVMGREQMKHLLSVLN
jgi:hypothetical protein